MGMIRGDSIIEALGVSGKRVALAVPTVNAVILVDAGVDTSLDEGSLLSRIVTITDSKDNGAAGWGYSIDYGDGSALVTGTSPTLSFPISHLYVDGNANHLVSVTVTDGAAESATDTFSVAVANVAPVPVMYSNVVIPEGTTYTIDLAADDPAGAYDPLLFTVIWGDDSYSNNPPTGPGIRQHQYRDDATGTADSTPYTVRVTVSDDDQGISFRTHVVTVVNVAPTAAVSGADTAAENSVYALAVGPVTDPGKDDVRSAYTIDWGDGVVDAFTPGQWATAAGLFTHAYGAGGAVRTVTVSTTDDDGTFVLGSKAVAVGTVLPPLDLVGTAATDEGAVYTLSVTAASAVDGSIDWGDGTLPQPIAGAGNYTHTFVDDEDGPVDATARTIGVTVVDGFGASSTQTLAVVVNNVAPSAMLSGAATVDEAGTWTLGVSAVADPGIDTRSGYAIAWGDGTVSSVTPAEWAAAAGSFSHVYGDGGLGGTEHTVTVSATDEDGSFVLGTRTLTVANVAPTLALTGSATTDEGADYLLGIAGSDVAGSDDPLSYSIDWGDGSALQVVTGAGSVGHVFADDQDGTVNATARTISVTASDDDGGSSTVQTRVVTVANVAPTAAVGGAASAAEGSAYVLTVGPLADPGADARTGYSIAWGDGLTSTYTPAQWDVAAGSLTHVYADGASAGTVRTATVSATDEDGTHVLGSRTLTVTNVAPTLVLGGNADTNEGAAYSLALGGSDPAGTADPLSYSINWGDGTAVQVVATTGNVTHVYADDAAGTVNATPRTISVTVNDGDGGSAVQTRVVNVNNVAPSAALSGLATVNERAVYTLTVGAITDPGLDTRTGYSIAWGDGLSNTYTPAQWSTAAGKFTHTYADGGLGGTARTITVNATDEDGTFAMGTKVVTVANVAPTLTLSGVAAVNEGASYTLGITGSDVAGTADPLSYSINWGDGSAPQVVATGGNVTHVFADDQDGTLNATARTISVTASDGDGGNTTVTRAVTVNNVAPKATVTGAATAPEGSTYLLSVSAVTEPGADARTGYTIAWGDATSSTYTPAQWAAAAGSFGHVYADGTSAGVARTVTVSATDEDGTFVLGTKALTVTNVAPTVVLGGNAATNEGAAHTLNIAATDPAGAADPLSYSIVWGDGSVAQVVTAAQLLAAGGNVTHVFTDDATGTVNATPRTIAVTVTDGDGGSTVQSRVVTVNNVAPTAPLAGTASVNEGGVYALSVGAVVDPGTDTRSGYTIAWGDGTSNAYTPAQWSTAAGNFTHLYADGDGAGTARTITVSTTDDDGSFVMGTQALTVANVAPTASVTGADLSNEGSVYTLSVGAVSDPGTDTRSGYSIAWGDGSTDSFTPAQWAAAAGSFQHSFADGGKNGTARTVTVSATDEDGSFVLGSKSLTVLNVAPTPVITFGPGSLTEGTSYTINLSAADPAGAYDVAWFSVDWGDGFSTQSLLGPGPRSHTYRDDPTGSADTGTHTVRVTVYDEDDGMASVTQGVTVTNVAPTATVGGAAVAGEGSVYTLSVGAVVDPGTDVSSGYTIDWGDGSTDTVTSAQWPAAAGSFGHVYADGDGTGTTRTVTVSTTDDDGSFVLGTWGLTVANVAPTLALGGAAAAVVGDAYLLSLGAVTDPGQDSVTGWVIDWGDGQVETVTAGGDVGHVFASAGSRTIAVGLVDEDGLFAGAATLTLEVSDPVATVALDAGADTSVEAGGTLVRSLVFTDGQDDGNPGWGYTIDYGDGSAAVSGTTLTPALDLSHLYADGGLSHTVMVSVTDIEGETATDGFVVTVNSPAPLGLVEPALAGQVAMDLAGVSWFSF